MKKYELIPKYRKKISLQLKHIDDIIVSIAKVGGVDRLMSRECNAFKKDLNFFVKVKSK